jgi:O-antigen/teichoic acid export membrane protein
MFGGASAYSLSQWLIISLLAHMGGPVPVGEFTLAMSIAGPLVILFSLSSRTLLQTDVGLNPKPFKDYWHLRLATSTLFLLCMLAIIVWRNDARQTQLVIVSVSIFKAVEALTDVACGLSQRNGHYDLVSRSLFLRGVLGVVAFTGLFWFTGNVVVASAGIAFAWLAIFGFHDWALTRRWHGALQPLDAAALLAMAWQALPLGIGVFINGFNVVVPRLVLEHNSGIKALGIFSAVAYLLTLGNLAVGAIGNTMLTRLARFWEDSDVRAFMLSVGKATAILLTLGIAGTVTAWIAGEPILRLLYGKAFSGNSDLFILVAFAGTLVMVGTFWSYALLGTKNFGFQLLLNLLTFASVAGASYLLIPKYDIFGAGCALVVLGVARCVASVANLGYALARKRRQLPAN